MPADRTRRWQDGLGKTNVEVEEIQLLYKLLNIVRRFVRGVEDAPDCGMAAS